MNVVSNVEIMGLASSVKASRYPMATDTENCSAASLPDVRFRISAKEGRNDDDD